jgi:hypothetical protein
MVLLGIDATTEPPTTYRDAGTVRIVATCSIIVGCIVKHLFYEISVFRPISRCGSTYSSVTFAVMA